MFCGPTAHAFNGLVDTICDLSSMFCGIELLAPGQMRSEPRKMVYGPLVVLSMGDGASLVSIGPLPMSRGPYSMC